MLHNNVFTTETPTNNELTKMPQWWGWYPAANPDWIPDLASQQAWRMANELEALPPGKRVLFPRWMMRYESYQPYGANPLNLFENGHWKASRMIQFLRPLGRELRQRGIHLDGVWTDNEGGATAWELNPQQLTSILSSPKARSKMPPAVKALTPSMFTHGSAPYRNAMITFNRYAHLLHCRSMRLVMVDSGVFRTRRGPGQPLVQPPTSNFWISAPTWPCYDYNNWPINSFSLDGRTSSPSCYLTFGGRHLAGQQHDPRWNALIDQVNLCRSCMRRPGALFWPTLSWPNHVNPWLFEQMIAHYTRTGVNATAGGCGYIYWRDPPVSNGNVEDPLVVQIFNRHDQPFAVQRNLPEIPQDVDTFTTAGFTTRYTDFLNNVPPLP